jgi:hypothetical protein
MGWRREIRDRIAELEHQRLRLEEERRRARRLGGPEGERLEAELRSKVQQISHHIDDLRAALEWFSKKRGPCRGGGGEQRP